MLVLSRKSGERIWIDRTVSVTVLAIRGGTVKLGLSGPPDVLFQREELCERIQPNHVRPFPQQRALEKVCH